MKQVFSGIPFVGQKVFQALPDEDLKRCRLVCKSWKGLIDDPTFWLKKLNTNGQPKEVHKEWLDLIEKAESWGVDKTQFVSSLLTKYFMLKKTRFELMETYSWTSPTHGRAIEKYFLGLPPIYITLLPENPNLEVIKIIMYFNEDFAKPIIVPEELRKDLHFFPNQINAMDGTSIDVKFLNPFTFAIKRQVKRVNMDVLRLMDFKIKDSWKCINDFNDPLIHSIERNDLEMCKFILEMLPIKYQNEIVITKDNHPSGGLSAIKIAMAELHVDIFAYLLSKTDNQERAARKEQTSLLHCLTQHCTNWDCPKSKSCKYAEKFHILVSKLTQFQEIEWWLGYTSLHNVITRLNEDENDECAKEMVKYLAPRTDSEITNLQGLTPIDLANTGSRKFLMLCKRKRNTDTKDVKTQYSKLMKYI